jgi:penicillin-binding protein 1A
MKSLLKLGRLAVLAVLGVTVAGLVAVGAAYIYIAPDLPTVDSLKDFKLQVPLRIFSRDGKLIAEFGEKKRIPAQYKDIPDLMIKAVLAAEDDRFFEHPGVDWQGILRAAYHLAKTGEKSQGGSTITMQVARNFFLSSEKTYFRKLSEIFLALKIDHELTKQEILELYLNKIYLGHRAYGIGAAAQVYYGTDLDHLTLAQVAMIAGLPKAPSNYNPVTDPTRAKARRNYVLRRMFTLGFIDRQAFETALNAPITAQLHTLTAEVQAPYVAEMVRSDLVDRFGDDAYTAGYKVYTTIDSRLQQDANEAIQQALLEYDRRHGYQGPERHIDLSQNTDPQQWRDMLDQMPVVGGLAPALITAVQADSASALLEDGRQVEIPWDGMKWAQRFIDVNSRGPAPQQPSDVVSPGDVVRLEALPGDKWQLAEIPQVEGALVSLRPRDGAVVALTGGFDFYYSKFNRVIQAARQPGSSFKPFIYSAALEKGFTFATLINDAPVVFQDQALESVWRPENYSGKFHGPTRLREGLVHSLNLVSIRLLQATGVDYVVDYLGRFGFDPKSLPRNLSLALGSSAVTPMQLTKAYAVFANGGYRIEPFYIDRIEDIKGQTVVQANPPVACPECTEPPAAHPPQAAQVAVNTPSTATDAPADRVVNQAQETITPQNDYLITSALRDVIRRGTGRRARALGRHDLAGKTGTTNDQRDAWFAGYNAELVTTAWVGFDQTAPLGRLETGARAALPMWIKFMGKALRGVPEKTLSQPPGLVTVRIDPETGYLANTNDRNAIFEIFRSDHVPKQHAVTETTDTDDSTKNRVSPEQLF